MTKCTSCHEKFPTIINVAPYNIVLRHAERYFYPDVHTMQVRSSHKTRNHRYHVDLSCLRRRHPHFTGDMIIIPPEVRADLKPVHFEFLKVTFDHDFS